MMTWDEYYIGMAKYASCKSKDPNTKVGAVVVRKDKSVASVAYNGLPRGVNDTDDRLLCRDTKLQMILHAEENAILSSHERLDGCTLYVWPMPPCSLCAAKIIQSGITRVVSPSPGERWAESCRLGSIMLEEAGVDVELVDS